MILLDNKEQIDVGTMFLLQWRDALGSLEDRFDFFIIVNISTENDGEIMLDLYTLNESRYYRYSLYTLARWVKAGNATIC